MTTEALATLLARPGLSDAAKVVYLALVGFCPAGEGTPTNRQLSAATGGRSEDAIRSALRLLEESGLVAFRLIPGLPRVAVLDRPPAEMLGVPPRICGGTPGGNAGTPPRENATPRESAGGTPRESAGGPLAEMRGVPPRIHGGSSRTRELGISSSLSSLKSNSEEERQFAHAHAHEGNGLADGLESNRGGEGDRDNAEDLPTLQADSIPDDFRALARKTDRLLAGRGTLTGRALLEAWAADPRIPCWWSEGGMPRFAWDSALDKLAAPGFDREKISLRYYLATVRGLARDLHGPAAHVAAFQASAGPEVRTRAQAKPEPTPAYLLPPPVDEFTERRHAMFARHARRA
jgi:hypothetical protein